MVPIGRRHRIASKCVSSEAVSVKSTVNLVLQVVKLIFATSVTNSDGKLAFHLVTSSCGSKPDLLMQHLKEFLHLPTRNRRKFVITAQDRLSKLNS